MINFHALTLDYRHSAANRRATSPVIKRLILKIA